MSHVKIIRENSNTGGGAVYCLGLIGAWIYFFGQSDTFVEFVVAFFKGIVWPAYVAYHALSFFKI